MVQLDARSDGWAVDEPTPSRGEYTMLQQQDRRAGPGQAENLQDVAVICCDPVLLNRNVVLGEELGDGVRRLYNVVANICWIGLGDTSNPPAQNKNGPEHVFQILCPAL